MAERKRNPPAYQQYASDTLANERYRLMTLAERGLLESMRMQAWVSGDLPASHEDLARLLGVTLEDAEQNLTPAVLSFFRDDGQGRMFCPELIFQRQQMDDIRTERSRSGRKGAEALHRRPGLVL